MLATGVAAQTAAEGASAAPAIAELPVEPPTSLPPMDFGPPLVMPPVSPPKADLLAPLPPISTFDTAPRSDFIFTQVAEAGLRYSVLVEGLRPTGLEPTFRRMSALLRADNRPATPAQIASRTNSDKALIGRLLTSEGWYSGDVEGLIDPVDDTAVKVSLLTAPGERYRWREITLDLIPADRPELAEGFGLSVGDPVRAIAVEEAEGALLLKLTRSGYPFPEIGARDVVLDADQPTATYLLTGFIGEPGIFGSIRLTGFQPFDNDHAKVIARFKTGEPYDSALVDDFRRALINTQLFAGVTVTPTDSGLREPDGRIVTDMVVQGNTGPLRLLTGQIGFSTREGFRAEALWRHRNLVQPEGAFTARAVLGTIEQRVAAELIMSNFHKRDRTLSLVADVANLRRPAYEAQLVTLRAAIARASTPIWQKRWTWSAGVELVASDERERAIMRDEAPDPAQVFLIAALPAAIGYDRSDDLLDPQKGFRLGLAVTPELSRQGGNFSSYGRFIADASAYRGFGEQFVLAGRVRLGSIIGADRNDIAPTRRLYSGGGGSVRGFDYQGIGPLGENDRPLGGRGLAEASIEGRYRFGDFGVVGFVDAGAVSESSLPSLSGTRVGIGVGGRYYTSFGPIRFDVARGINRSPRDPAIAVYISIGQAF